jgi:4-amino-4-deoxy-L-arabinose transferase-like glycosyltransferase
VRIQPNKIVWSYILLLVAVSYLFGLFIDLTGDSGLYAAISRQMVESGNWLNLKINGVPYDQKPHLFFWLAGLGIQLFGNTNFAFKLFPFLWALAGIYFTYRLGKLLFSDEAGKWAALIMATSQMTFLYLFDYHTDSVLFPGVTLALWQLAAYLKTGKSVHFILGFLGVGLAMLSKGPVGAVLPFFAVLYYFFMKKDYRQLFHYKWIFGVLLVLVVISPALIHLYNNFDWDGIRFYFITNNFGRISGEYAGSSTDPFFYLHTLIWAFLPWTVFVIAALFSGMKKGFNPIKPAAWTAYLLGSALVLLVILSMAKGKAPNYFFIAVSPFSVLAGDWLTSKISNPEKIKQPILITQWFVVGLIILIFGMALYINLGNNNWLPLVLIAILLIIVAFTIRIQKDKLKRVILISLLLAGTLNLFLDASVIPHLRTTTRKK